MDVDGPPPPPGVAPPGRRIAVRRTFKDKAFEAAAHDLVAFLHIDGEAADIGHEDTRPAGNVGPDIPGAAGRAQRDGRYVVDVLDPGVLISRRRLDGRCA